MSKSIVKSNLDNNYNTPLRKNFFSKSHNKNKLTVGTIRKAIEELKQCAVRPDMDGNLRYLQGYGFIDERYYWLGGKPVGGA